MKRLILIVALAGIFSGCHKKPSEAPAQNPQASAGDASSTEPNPTAPIPNTPPPGAKPLPAPPPPVAARAVNYVQANVSGTPDPFLTGQLRTFIEQKHRMPESFAEFAMNRLDSVPRPPEGQKWVIDTSSLEVKACLAK